MRNCIKWNIFLIIKKDKKRHARSRLISEAKQGRAWLVLGWVTAWEYQVLKALYFFNSSSLDAMAYRALIFSAHCFGEFKQHTDSDDVSSNSICETCGQCSDVAESCNDGGPP